jgi:hypothetical protein
MNLLLLSLDFFDTRYLIVSVQFLVNINDFVIYFIEIYI